MEEQIKKEDFLKLVDHPHFVLTFSEAPNGQHPLLSNEPYGEHVRDDVLFAQRDTPAQTTHLDKTIARLLDEHDAAEARDNKLRWRMLTAELTDSDWKELWARNGYREAVAWAIEKVKAEEKVGPRGL